MLAPAGYSDAAHQRVKEVTVGDVIKQPELIFGQKNTPEEQDNLF